MKYKRKINSPIGTFDPPLDGSICRLRSKLSILNLPSLLNDREVVFRIFSSHLVGDSSEPVWGLDRWDVVSFRASLLGVADIRKTSNLSSRKEKIRDIPRLPISFPTLAS